MPLRGFDKVLARKLAGSWWNPEMQDLKINAERCWNEWDLGRGNAAALYLNNDSSLTPEDKLYLGEALVIAYPPGSRQSHRGLLIWEHAVTKLINEDRANSSVRVHGLKLLERLIDADQNPKRFNQVIQLLRAVLSPVDTELEALRREADAKFSGRAPCAVIDIASRRRR